MRRFVWMTLQALSVLSLTACFTFIDFDLDDAAGGSGGAATASVATGTGGNPLMGGNGGEGGRDCDADLQTSPENCGACGHDCEGAPCAAGVCQGVQLLDTGRTVGVMGVGGQRIAFQASDDNTICFVDKNSPPQEGTVITCQDSNDAAWTGLGTAVAVDPDGVAYYSPQAADNDHPVYKCDGLPKSKLCYPMPQALPGNATQLNGLLIYGNSVFGINPEADLWQVPLDGTTAPTIEFQVTGGDGTDSLALAAGGGSLVIGVLGDVTPACVAVASETVLIPNGADDDSECTIDVAASVPGLTDNARLSAVAAGPKGSWAARVSGNVDGNERALTMVHPGDANPSDVLVLSDLAVLSPAPALVGDEKALYFYGQPDGFTTVHVYRCLYDGVDSCAPISGNVDKLGAIALDETHVYFSSGQEIFGP